MFRSVAAFFRRRFLPPPAFAAVTPPHPMIPRRTAGRVINAAGKATAAVLLL